MKEAETVGVIDDDAMVRQSLAMLLESQGIAVRRYASGCEFLDDPLSDRCACVVLDARMPGLSGLEVQARMAERGMTAPVIFITGHGDVPMAVEAMRGGAIDFLQKPFSNQALLERVGQAIGRGREMRLDAEQRRAAEARLAMLSRREREVLAHLVDGKMNKAIAAQLGISAKTVEDHRASIMKKMQVRSVAALVRLAAHGRCDTP